MDVTISDIAKEVGVSRGTVDRVLNHRGRVSKETILKVEEAARKLGYQKGIAGAGLAARKKKFHLCFVSFGNEVPFHRAVFEAARKEAENLSEYGVTVEFFFPAFPDDRGSVRAYAAVHKEIDGWAVPGFYVDVLQDFFKEEGIAPVPVAAYNTDCQDKSGRICFVGCDYLKSGKIACGLIALMTNKMAQVLIATNGPEDIESARVRREGFLSELSAYPGMRVIDTIATKYPEKDAPPDFSKQFDRQYEESVGKAIRENEKINAVYLLNPGDYTVCDVIHKAAGDRPMVVVTNDLVTDLEREMIRDGRITAAIDQEPARQGIMPLRILFRYLAMDRSPEKDWEKCRLSIIIRQNADDEERADGMETKKESGEEIK